MACVCVFGMCSAEEAAAAAIRLIGLHYCLRDQENTSEDPNRQDYLVSAGFSQGIKTNHALWVVPNPSST